MEKRRLVLEVDGQGGIEMSHDNFSAAELATMALVIQDKAMETLKNAVPAPMEIKGPATDGAKADI